MFFCLCFKRKKSSDGFWTVACHPCPPFLPSSLPSPLVINAPLTMCYRPPCLTAPVASSLNPTGGWGAPSVQATAGIPTAQHDMWGTGPNAPQTAINSIDGWSTTPPLNPAPGLLLSTGNTGPVSLPLADWGVPAQGLSKSGTENGSAATWGTDSTSPHSSW